MAKVLREESGYDWMADGSSGLMQPLWAPQPNIYNSGITRGGEQKLVGIQMVLLRLIGAPPIATKLSTTDNPPSRENKDTQDKKAKLDKILFVLAITLLGKRTQLTSMN